MLSSKTVANELLKLAWEKGESLTPMQLLKLVYISHGWMLGLYHRSLISDEVQAWQYGPVIPVLYNAIRKYRSSPVTQLIECSHEDIGEVEADLIRQVSDAYGDLSGPALSRLTHTKNSPWDLVYEPGSFGVQIPVDLIEDHYAELAA